MSQNFSEMSDMFVPELMELDSYWRKAVEDAICDTLKGERRLHYALRNRKKINQKLEKLGLKAGHTQVTLANRFLQERNSGSSLEGDPSRKDPEPPCSKSCSKTYRDTPSETKHKSPDRPLLGDGSLEKMKKSQNSFNCEPMGENHLNVFGDDCDSEKDDEGQFPVEEGSKKIQWLHVREDTEFDDSDSEEFSNTPSKEDIIKTGPDKFSTFKNTVTLRQKPNFLKNVRDNGRGNHNLEKKLELALAKRKIVKEVLHGMRGVRKVQLSASGAQAVGRRRRGASETSAFIQLYLEVYRELFQKCSPKEIESEATKRWWCMAEKQKSKHTPKKLKKKKVIVNYT